MFATKNTMTCSAFLIFPNQLFEDTSVIDRRFKVYLIEEPRFFNEFNFHKNKIVLHRASMQYYFGFLKKKGYDVEYLECDQNWLKNISLKNFDEIFCYEINDFPLEEKIKKRLTNLKTIPSPMFLCSLDEFGDFFEGKKHFHQTSFYIFMRKKLKILVDENNKPQGGEWTFDKENRKKLPKNIEIPEPMSFVENRFVKEAKKYVEKNFPNNVGDFEKFNYPTTFEEAKTALDDFIGNRFSHFGEYQDAIKSEDSFLFHSFLSSSLNIGLLTPGYVVQKASTADVGLNSKEGFVRQIIGWREFIRGIYALKDNELKTSNFWSLKKELPAEVYTAKTGILPVDNVIEKMLENAYANHIERLMILGNYFLLSEINPKHVYRWFMEMSIDSYDWVMAPNVYGMSQFAMGPVMTTKPYICSSNYILKMSDFKKGDWCKKWDMMLTSFVRKNSAYLKTNPRMSLFVSRILNY